jgi:hypothetical protein
MLLRDNGCQLCVAVSVDENPSTWNGLHHLDRHRRRGAFIVGILVLGEIASPMRMRAAALIIGGSVLMKMSS